MRSRVCGCVINEQTVTQGHVVYKYALKYRACIGQAAFVPASDEISLGLAACARSTQSDSPWSYIESHRTQALVGCSEDDVNTRWILSISSSFYLE